MFLSRLAYPATRKHRLQLPLFVCNLALLACTEPDVAVPGELGRASFRYECVYPEDYHCIRGDEGLPERIAVGARFRVKSDMRFGISAQPVSPERVRTAYRDQFEFVRPGFTAFVTTDSGDDELVDFVHLLALPVTDLRIHQGEFETAEVEIAKNRHAVLSIVPYHRGESLSGSLTADWASSDSHVVRITERRGVGVTVLAADEGVAEITASFGDVNTSVVVTVGPKQSNPIPSDADPPSEDGGAPASSSDAASGEAIEAGTRDAASSEDAGLTDELPSIGDASTDGGADLTRVDASSDGGSQ